MALKLIALPVLRREHEEDPYVLARGPIFVAVKKIVWIDTFSSCPVPMSVLEMDNGDSIPIGLRASVLVEYLNKKITNKDLEREIKIACFKWRRAGRVASDY